MSIGTYPSSVEVGLPLSVSQGGTGATTAANARTNLGLGTLSVQNANAVAITGGGASFTAPLNVGSAVTGQAASLYGPVGIGIAADPSYALRSSSFPVWFGGAVGISAAPVAGFDLVTGAGNIYIGGSMGFGVNPPLAKIDVNGTAYLRGNLGIGVAPAGGAALFVQHPKDSAHGILIHPINTDSVLTSEVVFQNVAGTAVGSITSTASATAYNTSSDVRLKHAIAALTGALDAIVALRPVRFRWNADDSVGHGFLAHELQATIPDAVSGLPDAVNEDGTIQPQQVDHSKLVPWLVSGMQALLAQVDTLTARVAALEGGGA